MNVTFANQATKTQPSDPGGKMPPETTKPKITPMLSPRKRGRPRKGDEVKPFVSLLQAPPKFEINNPHDFFSYIAAIPKESRANRITMSFYRYFPACDTTEGGEKNKYIAIIPGEQEPFPFEKADAWENVILHLFGSGDYGCYFNEMNRTICRCLNIKTRWDLENYPPVLDTNTVIPDYPRNKSYIQWLAQKGVRLPTEADREREETEMQIAETVSKLADTVIAQSARAQIPVPPANNDRVISELVRPMMSMMESANKSAIDTVKSQQSANDPLATIGAIGVILKDLKGGGGGDDTIKLLLQDSMRRAEASEARSNALLDKLITRDSTPQHGELKEFLENMKLAREAFGNPDKDGSEAPDKAPKETLAQTILATLPTVLPPLLGLVDRGIMIWNMRQPTAAQLRGPAQSAPAPGPSNPYAMQAAQAAQAAAANAPGGAAHSAQPEVQQAQVQPVNPATGLPFTPEELAQLEARSAQLAQYNQFLAPLAPAIIAHLNDPGQVEEDGQLVKKTGYDLAQWVIDGYGRVAYESIKGIGADTLFDAIRNYPPLWSQISGIEPKVREFVGEFVALDEYIASGEAEVGEA